MSTAVNKETIKRKGGKRWGAHNRSWKNDSESRERLSMQNGT